MLYNARVEVRKSTLALLLPGRFTHSLRSGGATRTLTIQDPDLGHVRCDPEERPDLPHLKIRLRRVWSRGYPISECGRRRTAHSHGAPNCRLACDGRRTVQDGWSEGGSEGRRKRPRKLSPLLSKVPHFALDLFRMGRQRFPLNFLR